MSAHDGAIWKAGDHPGEGAVGVLCGGFPEANRNLSRVANSGTERHN